MQHQEPRALTLTTTERKVLERWSRASATPQSLALRARIVLACAQPLSNRAVAERLGIHSQTVGKWRRRFLKQRLAGLEDAARPGRPREIPAGAIDWVLALTLLSSPKGADRWTTQSLADACALSQSAVARIWRDFRLQPASEPTSLQAKEAELVDRFAALVTLNAASHARSRVWVYTEGRSPALPRWLRQLGARVRSHGRVDLILCDCDPQATAAAELWGAEDGRFRVYSAPEGAAWRETLRRWFPRDGKPGPGPAVRAIAARLRTLFDPARDSKGMSESISWSPEGRRVLDQLVDDGFLTQARRDWSPAGASAPPERKTSSISRQNSS